MNPQNLLKMMLDRFTPQDDVGTTTATGDKKLLLDLVNKNKLKYRVWNAITPNTERSISDLKNSIETGQLQINRVPDNMWEQYKINNLNPEAYKGTDVKNVGGWMSGDKKWININESAAPETIDHELLHYFGSHRAGEEGAPDKSRFSSEEPYMNPYLQLDSDLGGWLPSLHPNAARPMLPGDNVLSRFWNKNIASNALETDRALGYHTWTGQSAYNRFTGAPGGPHQADHGFTPAPKSPKPVPEAPKSKSFGSSFKEARKAGLEEFEWKGKKYHTKTKEEVELAKKIAQAKNTTVPQPDPATVPLEYESLIDYVSKISTDRPTYNNKVWF